MMIILTICRKLTINVELSKRLFAYFCLIFFGSLVADFTPLLIKTFIPIRIHKNHLLNVWFVKIGWFWVWLLLVPFVHLTAKIIQLTPAEEDGAEYIQEYTKVKLSVSVSKAQAESAKQQSWYQEIANFFQSQHFFRLLISTVLFFTSTSIFTWYEEATSMCSISSINIKEDCIRSHHRWSGFDISGHAFLLLFSNLIILEECGIMKGWESFGERLSSQQYYFKKTFKLDEPQYVAFQKYNMYIRGLFMCLTLLSLLWDFMLFQTVLFYHTLVQKFVAFVWAIGLWFLTYRIIFKSKMYIQCFERKKLN